MAEITIGYTDGSHFQKNFIKTVFYNLFPDKKCTFVKDPEKDPDYIIFSTTGTNHTKYKKSYKILIKTKIGDLESYSADLIIDTINDTKHLPSKTNMIYIPYYVISFYERFKNGPNNLIKPKSYNAEEILKSKTKFCAFLYHNCDVKYRNKFFYMLHNYNKVDALGTCLSKLKKETTDRFYFKDKDESYHDKAVQKYRPYKFVICFESAKQKGYISEKIINSMLSNCIPIYYGADDITEHFNEKCFINANKFKQFDECIELIKKIDKDDKLYIKMLEEAWLNNNKLSPWFSIGLFVETMKKVIKSTS